MLDDDSFTISQLKGCREDGCALGFCSLDLQLQKHYYEEMWITFQSSSNHAKERSYSSNSLKFHTVK
ncbi:hypothetical protein H5410_038763 [Solanum commersonii]|uniref:Uncharacterized protein n=1 Tax=Solanum commersonii TaxID=4109 RepID=A0A9J5Y9X4_SOLCO|nr:hypothetical protein H5410_038763 [Solanum commersonii]